MKIKCNRCGNEIETSAAKIVFPPRLYVIIDKIKFGEVDKKSLKPIEHGELIREICFNRKQGMFVYYRPDPNHYSEAQYRTMKEACERAGFAFRTEQISQF